MCVLKCCDEMISEVTADVTTFLALLTLFGVLAEERLLVEGYCPRRDVGCATRFGRADEWVLGDKGVLSRHQDKTEVAVLAPAAETLNQRRVCD